MKKRSNSRLGLSTDTRSWLDGEERGWFQFKHADELESVWNEHGDDSKMFWRRDMSLPITLDDLEVFEDEWLNSADNDEYGRNSFFVGKYYSDAEKQVLWDERGDRESYYWKPGIHRPEAIDEMEDAE